MSAGSQSRLIVLRGMLEALRHDHQGRSWFSYRDVPFETVARHATRPQAAEFGLAVVQSWYRERDLLPRAIEQVIGQASTMDDTVQRIMRDTGPATCPPPLPDISQTIRAG